MSKRVKKLIKEFDKKTIAEARLRIFLRAINKLKKQTEKPLP